MAWAKRARIAPLSRPGAAVCLWLRMNGEFFCPASSSFSPSADSPVGPVMPIQSPGRAPLRRTGPCGRLPTMVMAMTILAERE